MLVTDEIENSCGPVTSAERTAMFIATPAITAALLSNRSSVRFQELLQTECTCVMAFYSCHVTNQIAGIGEILL